ncbi:MAG TPA: histidinol-phosphate transaminase [Aquabacterium sp.]|uniref:histidinol-phosphate transaminase n=1 Tax=Aquabacterium sp. TaxID=1872578 RepID=UPI002E32E25C|nr:histidinol-phosphate transaminase [Aquabacterium sp.]HEX5355724.1 histidinol-phosphate transaminase [Aquabacterium sp.]
MSLLDVFRPDVRAMHAYVVQDAAGYIKLDAMENPFTLPPELQAKLGERLGQVAMNRYPGVRVNDLHAALRAYAHVPADHGLVLGNGSDELISLLSVACAQPGAVALAPLPGFVMYEAFAKQSGMQFVGVPLTPDFELDGPAMLAAIRAHKPALTYIAYPNNPTANLWDDAVIEQIIDAVGANGQGLVIIDEAYQPFASKSYLERLTKHPHVLLMRTLSKFGLAGIRLGYMMGRKDLIEQVEKVRPPYNISVLNVEAALFALEHADEFARQAEVIKSERERLLSALATMPGAQAYPSQANMILVRVNDAAGTFNALKAKGILIKNVAGLHGLLANCIRLTVGKPSENDALIAALTELLREPLNSNPA